jgi:hypothetical protein
MEANATIAELLGAIRRLPPDSPVHDPRKWYQTQHEHWIRWLEGYTGPGAYSRKRSPPPDARSVYNRIVEPKMLLWLIEAVGIDAERVAAAKASVMGATTMMHASGRVRRLVPWEMVAAALATPRRGVRWLRRGPA